MGARLAGDPARGWILILAACGGAPAPVANAKAGQDVEFAIVTAQSVRVYLVGKGLSLERTLPLPSSVGILAWVGKRPVAMLRASQVGDERTDGDPKRDGEIGWLDGARFEPFAALPAATWAAPPPKGGEPGGMYSHQPESPGWTMVVSDDGEVWQGRSEWWFMPDAGGFDNWVYARLAPKPTITTLTEPKRAPREYALVGVAAPASITATIDKQPMLPLEDGETEPRAPHPAKLLHCKAGATTVEFPLEGEDRLGVFDVDKLTWLVTDPPMFQIDEGFEGFTGYWQQSVFEGCVKSTTFTRVVAGPDGVVAMFGKDKLVVVRDGKIIGTATGGSLLTFR